MNLRWIKRIGILSAVFFFMSGFAGLVSAEPMPAKPTWHDVRNELKKLKKHPKPVQIEKQNLEQKELHGDSDIKPVQDAPREPHPILDPKAAHKDPNPNHAKGKELAPGQLKKADGVEKHENAKALAPGHLKKDKEIKDKANHDIKMKKDAPKPGKK